MQPLHSFTVAEPDEWVALLLFLLTAVITGQLAADQRRRAQQAERREREAVVLYDVVRLMAEPDVDRALGAVAERLRQELQLAAVAIDLKIPEIGFSCSAEAGDPESLRLARSATPATSRLLGEGQAPTDCRRGAPRPMDSNRATTPCQNRAQRGDRRTAGGTGEVGGRARRSSATRLVPRRNAFCDG